MVHVDGSIGWVRLKEYGYFPLSSSGILIRSGTVSKKAGRFFVTILVSIESEPESCKGTPLGIDLGIKDFAVISNGEVYRNINKTERIRKLEKKLKREQRKLSRRKPKKGGTAAKNYSKQLVKVQRLHQRLASIRLNYQNQIVFNLTKTKPSYIAIEDLNVSGMMKNRHLSRAIASQGFNMFKERLISKCKAIGIELRVVDRWYASSKICHECGSKNPSLDLSERVFTCGSCGHVVDRDYNASLNIRDCQEYKVA